MTDLLLFLLVLAVSLTLGNILGWRFSRDDDQPWNVRALLGPWAYHHWLERAAADSMPIELVWFQPVGVDPDSYITNHWRNGQPHHFRAGRRRPDGDYDTWPIGMVWTGNTVNGRATEDFVTITSRASLVVPFDAVTATEQAPERVVWPARRRTRLQQLIRVS